MLKLDKLFGIILAGWIVCWLLMMLAQDPVLAQIIKVAIERPEKIWALLTLLL